MACGLFDTVVAPALAAYRYVSVVTSDFELLAFCHEVAVGVYARVYYCLASAGACALYHVDRVGDFKQASRAFE